jgi:toxin ParE1/3/4
MAEYTLSPQAIRDLAELEDFLSEREGEDRALAVIARQHRAMASLTQYPGMGRRRRDLLGAPLAFPVRSWMIFYRPTPDRTGIEIIRVIDGHRDIQLILGWSKRI